MIGFPKASIHGRFQIIHLDHYTYFRQTLEKYGSVYIGLTGLMLHQIEGGVGRLERARNPLTYYERVMMWQHVLRSNGLDREDVRIGPFPIEAPKSLHDFIPPETVCATTIREDWNRQKIEMLRAEGYAVDVLLEDCSKAITSSAIRGHIRHGDERWRRLVPAGVSDFLASSGLLDRIARPVA